MTQSVMKSVVPAVATALCLCAAMVRAEPLAMPQGPVLLTVTGAIARTNVGDTAQFDLEMLRAIGSAEIVTETIWTPGTQRFTGVSLDVLLGHLGAEGTVLVARAINDYAVEIPVTDAIEGGPIIAYEMDGTLMTRRDKGPLWVIYPFSSSADYRTEVTYARSIWQLDRLTVVE